MDARTPTVAMLWESTDPHAALAKRFGFRDAPDAAAWIAGVLAQHWALDLTSCGPLVISGRNVLAWIEADGRRLIMKSSALPRPWQPVPRRRAPCGLRRAPLGPGPETGREARAADLGKAAVLLATQYRDWGPTSALVRASFVDATTTTPRSR